MTREELGRALAFYGIPGGRYADRLAAALDEINASETYKAGFELARRRIFSSDTEVLAKIWSYPSRDAFFGCCGMPAYATNLLIYSGYERHAEAMKRLQMDEWQVDRQKKLVTGRGTGADPDDLLHEEAGYLPAVFAAQFANGKVLQIGRLQFEFQNLDGKMPENRVGVHIPPFGPLTPESVDDALTRATPMLKELYGVDSLVYECHSWLLSAELTACLSEGSNILSFQKRFDTTPGKPCMDEVLDYVFKNKPTADYAALPEKTSLQRSVKAALLAGVIFHAGAGTYRI